MMLPFHQLTTYQGGQKVEVRQKYATKLESKDIKNIPKQEQKPTGSNPGSIQRPGKRPDKIQSVAPLQENKNSVYKEIGDIGQEKELTEHPGRGTPAEGYQAEGS